MKLAIYPGSFDPVTFGHMEIISRASKLFDKLIVLVSVNPLKPCSFSIEERKELLRETVQHEGLTNVEVDSYDGLLIDYFTERNADVIVKGLRAISDFEYEFQMAQANRRLCYKAETIFLTSKSEYTYLSSSMVKQIAMFGGDISDFVPEYILDRIVTRLKK
ncbi:MAG: pantetheine-phosphate adenylyltransferase [Eubacterium sp.]|nr:pantetheine-phosphate adenylyltransferase [Eubacterium sp.]